MRQATGQFRRATQAVAILILLSIAAVPARAADDLWALMKKPGHIILLRHSNAPGSVPESNDMDFKNCAIQRNLDQAGRDQAARIGEEFRKHKVSKVRIYSSQYCRATDTGNLLKLGPVAPLPILNQVTLTQVVEMREAGEKGREFLKKIPPLRLTMLISHVTNIQSMADVELASGEFAVVHLDKDGKVIVDGKMAVP